MYKIKVAIVDDHHLVREGIKSILKKFKNIEVICEGSNGKELIENIEKLQIKPEIALIDVSMPVMDGYETVKYLAHHCKKIKAIAISIHQDFISVFKMIDSGAKGYLNKDISPIILKETIEEVFTTGICLSSFVLDSLLEYQKYTEEKKKMDNLPDIGILSGRQLEFVILCCSEKPYKQIADEMGVLETTVNGYREFVFNKLGIQTRMGILLYAFNVGIYKPKF